MNVIKLVKSLYWRFIATPEAYARHIGVNIGKNNLIGKKHWSSEPYLITVGSNCQLTDSQIFTHGGGQAIRHLYPDFDCFGKVVIGDYVYIGAKALIMPGVTIGDHCIVAAGSVVTKSVPSGSMVGGNPAKVLGNIEDYYERNKQYDLRSKNRPNKKEFLLSLPDSAFIKK